jgi:hypothetical protein
MLEGTERRWACGGFGSTCGSWHATILSEIILLGNCGDRCARRAFDCCASPHYCRFSAPFETDESGERPASMDTEHQ